MEPLIGVEELGSIVQIWLLLPRVLSGRVSQPLNQVLHSAEAFPMSDDGFDFEFFFTFNDVRRWERKVGAVGTVLMVRGQEGSVEYQMDPPLLR